MAFGTIFSLDMKALPVTISWLWSRFILKLSVCLFVRRFSQPWYQLQHLHLALSLAFGFYLMPIEFGFELFMLIRDIN